VQVKEGFDGRVGVRKSDKEKDFGGRDEDLVVAYRELVLLVLISCNVGDLVASGYCLHLDCCGCVQNESSDVHVDSVVEREGDCGRAGGCGGLEGSQVG